MPLMRICPLTVKPLGNAPIIAWVSRLLPEPVSPKMVKFCPFCMPRLMGSTKVAPSVVWTDKLLIWIKISGDVWVFCMISRPVCLIIIEKKARVKTR
ncbi:hypothetical protein [Moraxella lacunata]|uniref:hypothetical protein n=1 Tax=Moraxella lacunata TaxID=477 RepID=UPI003EE35C60